MSATASLLLLAAAIGAVDVLWWHLYKFRLYRQPGSVVEEITHLARYGLFLAVAVVLLAAPDTASVRWVVLGLFAADLCVTAVDVLAEPASREPLGGLPRLEYLVHVLASSALGAAVATFWWAAEQGAGALEGSAEARLVLAAGGTLALLIVETALFVRSRLGSSRSAVSPTRVDEQGPGIEAWCRQP